jgi:hypothetical protein
MRTAFQVARLEEPGSLLSGQAGEDCRDTPRPVQQLAAFQYCFSYHLRGEKTKILNHSHTIWWSTNVPQPQRWKENNV